MRGIDLGLIVLGVVLLGVGVVTGWGSWTSGGDPARGVIGLVVAGGGTLLIAITGVLTETKHPDRHGE